MGRNRIKDLIGKRFGILEVIKNSGRKYKGNIIWVCKCDCGNIKEIRGGSLLYGTTKSCGCRAGHSLPPAEANFNQIYSQYKIRARKRGYIFGLTKEEFKEFSNRNC